MSDDEQDRPYPTDQRVKNKCFLKPQHGRCRDYKPRWFYDTEFLLCKQFLYGGCGDNGNVFKTHDACMRFCVFEVPQEAGHGRNGVRRDTESETTGLE